ncbi:ATP-binding protein [Salinigranum sp. GCM10025319]|uniref:ATP-binding protein n=1 Tax=Salinigranum sp. GCM10025319 TaxID=3252687 RepID=UPI003622E4C3
MPSVDEVFDAGGYPKHTYVDRTRENLEQRLNRALRKSTSGATLVGPSKSGKTVLAKKVCLENGYQLVQVRGQQIGSVDELWNIVLDELDVPDAVEEGRSSTREDNRTDDLSVKPQGVGGSTSASETAVEATSQTTTYSRRGLRDVAARVDTDSFVLLIDDFHYVESEDLKIEIGRSIKSALEEGISICVAFVTHRGETLQKLVPDLESRVMTIRCELWEDDELSKIISNGEEALNIKFPSWLKEQLIANSIGSPMIMQRLCNASCDVAGITGTVNPGEGPITLDLSEDEFHRIIALAADWMGKRSVVREMRSGVQDSGRIPYEHRGGSKGDIYILGLRAIAHGDPTRSFRFSELKERIFEDCIDDRPNGPQIENFCNQMQKIAERERPNEEMVEWDSENNVLTISSPELLFLIRHLMGDYGSDGGFEV